MKRLQNVCALVTGGDSGIGKGIVEEFAAEGAQVVINFISDQEKTEQMAKKINDQGGAVLAVRADVSQENQVKAMFRQAVDKFGTVDILVNNAGIQQDADFVHMTLEQWSKVLDVNLTGGFLCAREAAREFIRRGVDEQRSKAAGKIIFISSVHEVIPWAHHCNYAASKGGMKLFMKSIAQELASQKIRVNSIAPGAIKTPINKRAWEDPEKVKELLKLIPANRVGVPKDIAKAAVWLASDESDYVHGATIFADGGMTLYPGFATGG